VTVEHPGPPPAAFEFPFDAARRARAQAEAARTALLTLVARHEAAFADAAVGFEGLTRQQFEAALAQQLDACRAHAEALASQADQLAGDLDRARQQQQLADERRARWERDLDRWSQTRREGATS
jgi:outer membrane murein-binding lipoprotein Lpp